MSFDRNSIAMAIGFTAFVVVGAKATDAPAGGAGSLQYGVRTVPVSSGDVSKVDKKLRVPGVIALASTALHDSSEVGTAMAMAKSSDTALEAARAALEANDFRRASTLARALITETTRALKDKKEGSEPETERTRDFARLILANVHMQTGQAGRAAKELAKVSDNAPVRDFVLYLRAENLAATGEHAAAAKLFAAVAKMNESPLKHRAIARGAHALYDAGDMEAARPALAKVIAHYPDYPRRYLALFEHAHALDQLGKPQEAADGYQATWFEFPYKKVGQQARTRLAELQGQAVVPSRLPTVRERFQRYRTLRINKHWDLARELLTELKEDVATPEGGSEMEHEIEFQLALNAYHSRAFDEARTRLQSLVAAYDAGKRAGISRYLVFKYLSKTHAMLQNHDAALAAIDRSQEGYGERSRLQARAEYYEDIGKSDKAIAIYDKLYSPGRKRGWHYTWLLYKTGKLDTAYENFSRLAERSYGRTRAKYLYWAGRTLERAGKNDEALQVFAEVRDEVPRDYYGIQAVNRMLDIQQRGSVAGALVTSADTLANSADQVLDALEAAEESMSELVQPLDDPRATPRHGLWGAEPISLIEPQEGPTCVAQPGNEGFCAMRSAPFSVAPATMLATALSSSSGDAPLRELEDASLLPDDVENDEALELDESPAARGRAPKKVHIDNSVESALSYSTQARIYWNGRFGSATAFAKAREGAVAGPVPDAPIAYDEPGWQGGLELAARKYGHLFPELTRAWWLHATGYDKGARWAARDVAIEFRELDKRWRPRVKPHELPTLRWNYYIDNRRKNRRGFWGLSDDEKRFPVPSKTSAKKALLDRQQAIYDARGELKPVIIAALKEAGDHFMVRKFTLAQKGWYRESPRGAGRSLWMQAYPRAFPKMVIENANKYGVNPYLLWALMTVESSYNPDSLSTADALGLLQVIPRTGLKTAIMLGDEEFGPQDLLEADTAIEHGAFYFSKLVHKFRGQELFAIAGYNGGPHRVGDWVEMRGHTMPMDEFVEEIPFNQARLYVKKVLRFLNLYLQIYENQDGLYVGQNIRVDYRPNPKF